MKLFKATTLALGGVSAATPGLWEQCRSENGTEVTCETGLVCVPDVEYFGLCYTEVVEAAGQCGGLGWNVSCVNGTTCERQNEGWATCESATDELDQAAEWLQCDPEGSGDECADNLVCVDDNDYHGLCVKEEAGLWGQCGGSGWITDCELGSWCEPKTETYSQCVPQDSSSGSEMALAAVSTQKQGDLSFARFVDLSSLLKPLARLQEIAKAAKELPCAMRAIAFPDTDCKSQLEQM
jgi:hypothetical protein